MSYDGTSHYGAWYTMTNHPTVLLQYYCVSDTAVLHGTTVISFRNAAWWEMVCHHVIMCIQHVTHYVQFYAQYPDLTQQGHND